MNRDVGPQRAASALTSADLAAAIAQQDIAAEIIKTPAHTPTVETAAEALGVETQQIAKTLLFLVDGRPYLVIGYGVGRVDVKKIADHFGVGKKRVKMADAETVLAITGYIAGSVPPFGHRQPLPALLDPGIVAQPEIYAGGGDINAMLRIAPEELRRVTAADVVSVME
jgi:Cys-tRNA(Pro) deacylase